MKLRIVLVVFLTVFVTVTKAQQTAAADTMYLDLKKVVTLAKEFNHDLKIAVLNSRIADERVTQAWGQAAFPKIDGSVNYRRALKRAVFFLETPFFSGSFPSGTENVLSAGVSVEQTLFSGGLFIAIRAAETYRQVMDMSLEASVDDLVFQTKQAYYSFMLAREVRDLSYVSLEQAEANLSDTQILYNAGLVSEYDLVRAKVLVQTARPDVNQVENAYEVAKSALKLVCGIDFNQPIEPSSRLSLEAMSRDPEFDAYYSSFLKRNPTLKQLSLQVELQDHGVSAEFANHLPSLTATGNWNVEAQENDAKPFSRWRYNNSVYVGLNLKIPLFDGWNTTARVEEARLNMMIAQENYEKSKRAMTNQLQETLLNLKNDLKQIEAYESTIEEAEYAFDISQKRFKSGLGTQLEVVDAQLGVTRAKINYYNGVFNYYVNQAALDKLLGSDEIEKN